MLLVLLIAQLTLVFLLHCSALVISSNRSNWYSNEYGWNALHEATSSRHLNCTSILLSSGLDVNSKNNYNMTALSWAGYSGHLQCMELLLARGADLVCSV